MSIIHVLSERMRLVSLDDHWWALERLDPDTRRWTPVEMVADAIADEFALRLFDEIGTEFEPLPRENAL